jgi:competence protein ComEC
VAELAAWSGPPAAIPLALGLLAGCAVSWTPAWALRGGVALLLLGLALVPGDVVPATRSPEGARARRRLGFAVPSRALLGCLASATIGLALGTLAACAGPLAARAALSAIDPGRPVTATAVVVGHPLVRGDQVVVALELVRLTQGRTTVALRHGLQLNAAAGVWPVFGSTLRIRGYLSRGVPLGNPGVRADPGPWRLRAKSALLVEQVAPPGVVARASAAVRSRLEQALGDRGPGLDLARALVLGDGSRLSPEVVRGLRRVGLSHVLSVSGFHLALLVGAAVALVSPLGRGARVLATVVAVVAYVLAVGPLPALLRSAWMALLVVLALVLERPPMAANALAVSVALLLLGDPALVGDLGFQLTVAATAGLIVLAPALARRWRALPGWCARPLAASVGAQLATLPLTLPLFPMLSPWSPLANLLLVPWTGMLLAASLLWTALAVLAPAAASSVVPLLDLLAMPLAWTARLDPAAWWLQSVPAASGVAVLVTLVAGAAAWWPRRGLGVLLVAWLGLAAGCGDARRVGRAEQRDPRLVALDVGQGDALVLLDQGRAWLIDGGGWIGGDLGLRVLVPALAALGVRSLDGILATHGDRDHCGGLYDLSFYLAVGEVAVGPAWQREGCLAELAARAGPRLRVVSRGSRIEVGRWRLEVLAPDGDEGGGDNERSVVVLARVADRAVLLTGDAGVVTEGRLLVRSSLPPLDVLKVGHHGSRTATSPQLLARARPRLALLSAGARNPYGHPSGEVLSRLAKERVLVLRTDRHGQVRLRFPDGAAARVQIEVHGKSENF